jgi:hypothetical protein
VAQGPAEPVQLPDDQGVAGAELLEELLEGGPVGAGAAGGLGEDPVAAGALEGVDLEVWLLVGGGDAGVAEQVTMPMTVAEPCDRSGCATLICGHGLWTPASGLVAGSGGGCRNDRFRTADL